MPELRSRPRRNRAFHNPTPNPTPITQRHRQPPQPAAITRQRKRTIAQTRRNWKEKNTIGAANRTNGILKKGDGAIAETKALKDKEEGEEGQAPDVPFGVLREEVRREAMDDYDSGGRSHDKAPVAEDEGSTAPLPDKVVVIIIIII